MKRHFSLDDDADSETRVLKHMHVSCPVNVPDFQNTASDFSNIPPCMGFADQHAILNLQSLQSETSDQYSQDCHGAEFKIKNPKFYLVLSRALVLDDFQYLVQQDIKILHDRQIKIKNYLTPLQSKAINEIKNNENIVIRQSDKRWIYCHSRQRSIYQYGSCITAG